MEELHCYEASLALEPHVFLAEEEKNRMRKTPMTNIGPDAASDAANVYLGRQPIVDRSGMLAGYELLYRDSPVNAATIADDSQATSHVIATMLGEFGLGTVLGSDIGYINVNRDILFSDVLSMLPPHLFVLEILETVLLEDDLLQRCSELRAQGFRLAFDDMALASTAALDNLSYVDIAKIDFTKCLRSELPDILAMVKMSGCTALAEKVETADDYALARRLGFDLFQGYYFARPEILSSRRLVTERGPLVSLLGLLSRDPGIRQIESELKRIPKLTIQLLRFANSGGHGLARPVSSLREATLSVGTRQIARWAQLLLYANNDDGLAQSDPLIQMIATRARFMELTAEFLQPYNSELIDQAFMTGVFSMAEAMFGSAGIDVMKELRLLPPIIGAISDHAGLLGAMLQCAEAVEAGDAARIAAACARLPGLKIANAARISIDAARWMTQHASR
ncbi:EAL and HDOD domain-containing protein [Robbsia betulipollinis]|nr:EAL domain-containing protein [Robbsia betulipollinis]